VVWRYGKCEKTEADFSIMHLFYLFRVKLTGKRKSSKKIKIGRFQSIGFEKAIRISPSV
jgi:hypothetical protein